jgi:flagellar protein FlbD
MIVLTRLNGKQFVVNAELIRFVEETPDTMLTLTTGDKLMVKEPMREVVRKAVDYGRSLRKLVPPT